MANTFQTEQEKFWAGEFGDQYIDRNTYAKELTARLALFAKILAHTRDVQSLIEFGANIGNNLKALKQLFPQLNLSAIEINQKAADALNQWGHAQVFHQSILDFKPQQQYDLSMTSGVLIHINPDMLNKVYDALYQSSGRYICLIEYYNPSPVEVKYRNQEGKLFKRDFAGEMLDRFSDLSLISYGFGYHRDPNYPLDDLTWFLLEKRS